MHISIAKTVKCLLLLYFCMVCMVVSCAKHECLCSASSWVIKHSKHELKYCCYRFGPGPLEFVWTSNTQKLIKTISCLLMQNFVFVSITHVKILLNSVQISSLVVWTKKKMRRNHFQCFVQSNFTSFSQTYKKHTRLPYFTRYEHHYSIIITHDTLFDKVDKKFI